jgi:transcriptional regulator with XRE-family HTH domain
MAYTRGCKLSPEAQEWLHARLRGEIVAGQSSQALRAIRSMKDIAERAYVAPSGLARYLTGKQGITVKKAMQLCGVHLYLIDPRGASSPSNQLSHAVNWMRGLGLDEVYSDIDKEDLVGFVASGVASARDKDPSAADSALAILKDLHKTRLGHWMIAAEASQTAARLMLSKFLDEHTTLTRAVIAFMWPGLREGGEEDTATRLQDGQAIAFFQTILRNYPNIEIWGLFSYSSPESESGVSAWVDAYSRFCRVRKRVAEDIATVWKSIDSSVTQGASRFRIFVGFRPTFRPAMDYWLLLPIDQQYAIAYGCVNHEDLYKEARHSLVPAIRNNPIDWSTVNTLFDRKGVNHLLKYVGFSPISAKPEESPWKLNTTEWPRLIDDNILKARWQWHEISSRTITEMFADANDLCTWLKIE